MVDQARVSEVLRRFAGTLVHEYDLDEVMGQFGKDAADILGAAGAGAMVADAGGHLRFVATSDERLDRLEQLQIELGEGPCLLAYETGRPVVASDLEHDARFPRFGPQALAAGMRAVHSFPMSLDEATVGALNLYTEEVSDLDEAARQVGQSFADVATIYLLHARDRAEDERRTAGLQKALDSRVVVEQAKGYLASRLSIDVADAFELLRGYARPRSIKVAIVARGVISGDLEVDELTADR